MKNIDIETKSKAMKDYKFIGQMIGAFIGIILTGLGAYFIDNVMLIAFLTGLGILTGGWIGEKYEQNIKKESEEVLMMEKKRIVSPKVIKFAILMGLFLGAFGAAVYFMTKK